MYNGNISETYWKTNNDNVQRMYGYTYDGLNRLAKATSYNLDEDLYDAYNEALVYDKNGNITFLQRNGGLESQSETDMIDNLSYFYDSQSKNQLLKVTDLSNSEEGFKDDATGTLESDTEDDYTYDNYGNMTKDENKKIETITYNHLNLPKIITFEDGNSITYTYDAAGIKLKKMVMQDSIATTTDYLSGFQYVTSTGSVTKLAFFPTAEGYVEPTETGGYQYVYNYTDHLGNIRLSYTFDTTTSSLQIREENNYYPFGLKQKGYNDESISSEYKYKYNGQELQDELGLDWYDYQARNYDPALGRWFNIDPASEVSRRYSPYTYALDNPIYFIDPDGMIAEDWDGDFYSQNGKKIGTDGNNDGKVYVVTNKDEVKSIKDATKSGNTVSKGDVSSAVELPSAFVRNEMGKAVDRTLASTDSDKSGNFHEEGGVFGLDDDGTECVSNAKSGEYSDPRVDEEATIDTFDLADGHTLPYDPVGTFHTHPGGEFVEGATGSNQIGQKTTSRFDQQPSNKNNKGDIPNARDSRRTSGTTHYVLGVGNNTVYVYDGNGVKATFPLKEFRSIGN